MHTQAGEAIEYDALMLALGGRHGPRYRHAITIDDRKPRRDPPRADPGHRGGLRQEPRLRRTRANGVAVAAVRARADDRRPRLRHGCRARHHARNARGQPACDLRADREHGGRRAARREPASRRSPPAYAEVPDKARSSSTPATVTSTSTGSWPCPSSTDRRVRGVPLSEHGFLRVDPYCKLLDVDGHLRGRRRDRVRHQARRHRLPAG